MKRTSAGSLLLLLALAAVVGALAWRSRGWPLVHDAPIMHYVAWRVLHGAAPYRDVFDMNFPGVYLVHMAVLRVLGAGDVAWRAFDLGWLAATAAAAGALAAPWGRAAAWGAALSFAAYHLAGGAWEAGQRDFLLCPFLLLGALGVARWLERRGRAHLVLGGLALGTGLTIKPQSALFAAALGAVVVVAAWRDGAGVLGPVAAFSLPLVAPVVAVVAWVGALGALAAWRDIVVGYLLPLYARLGRPARWGFYHDEVWAPIAAGVVLSLASAAARRALGPRHLVAALGLAYGVAHYFGQGKGWEYHAYPAAAFASVLLFAELDAAFAARPLAGLHPATLLRGARAAALGASVAVAVVLLALKGAEASDAAWIARKTARVDAVVRALAPRLVPGDTVQVLDTTDGGVHALLRLGVVEPTRFIYDFHFFHDEDHPTIRALRAELVRDLRARPPRAVVLFDRGWPAGGPERVARFPALAAFLAEGYAAAERGDGFTVYAQRHGS